MSLVICTYHNVNCSSIIVANRKDIRKLDESAFNRNLSHHYHKKLYDAPILIDQLEDAIALDFDYEQNLLFWTDRGLESIKYLNLTDRHIFDVANTGIESPESLACDWITKKLYWLDSDINNLVVSNYDGTQRNVLVWKNMDNPRTIVLVPSEG